MDFIRFRLLLCFSIFDCCGASFLAVFFTENTKSIIKENFFRSHESSSPFYGNTRHIYSEHSTIEFNPKSDNINKSKPHYGHVQQLAILAYAEDEHAQTILVHSTGDNDSHPSANEYPHVTISVSNVKPYTAVYSNDLWKRLVDDKIIDIKLDEYDKPQSILLQGQIDEWHGKLKSNKKYKETQAYVKVMNKPVIFNGTVCIDSLWENDECQNIFNH